MKKIKITIAMAAFAAGIFGAFAFKTAPVLQEIGDFYVNPDGSAGAAVSGTNECLDEESPLCSQQYHIEDGQPTTPTGQNQKNGPRE